MARRAAVLACVALVLAAMALAPVALPGLVQMIADRSTNPYTVGIENTSITLELVIPALAGRAGAMGAGAAALAAGRRRG